MRDIARIIPANDQTEIGTAGDFVFLKTAVKNVKVLVGGQTVEMRQGDRYQARKAFDSIIVQNDNSVSVDVVAIVGFGDYARSEVSGLVEVIDSEFNASLNDTAFQGGASLAATAAQYGHVQLWNAAGTGKNLVVNAVSIECDVNAKLKILGNTAALTTAVFNPASVLYPGTAGATVSVGEIRTQLNATTIAGSGLGEFFVGAYEGRLLKFRNPIVLKPDNGLFVLNTAVNTMVRGTFLFTERDI